MLPYNKLFYFISIILFFSIAGCSTKTICIFDHHNFYILFKHFAQLLQDRDIVDSKGYYNESRLSYKNKFLPEHIGEYLFTHLSTNIHCNTIITSPKTFAQEKSNESILKIDKFGFTLDEKHKSITVKLLAFVPWYNHDEKDWLLLCHSYSLVTNSSINYYLIFSPSTGEETCRQQLIAIYDNTSNTSIILATPIKNNAFQHTNNFFELEPGIYSILSSPELNPTNFKKEKNITEQQLQR